MIICMIIPTNISTHATQNRMGNYSRSYSLSGNGASDIVNVARAQIGKTGSQLGYSEEWCADFVGDCAALANQGAAIPRNGYCPSLQTAIKNAGGYEVSISSARMGDIAFYGPGGANHVEIVYANNNGRISTIGGNSGSGGSCYARSVRDHSYQTMTITRILRPNYGQASSILPGTVDTSWDVPANVTASHRITTYDQWGNAESNHYIDPGDRCYVAEVYTNGFVKVQYPVSGGQRWAYAKASDFSLAKKVSKPSYSNFWLSKKDASYALGDNIEINVAASNYDHLYVGIDKDGAGRVLTKEISAHYVFSSKDLGPGNYSVYVTVANSNGYVDTNKLQFKILTKPTYSTFWLSKKDTSYALGDNIEVNVGASNYEHLYVGIDKDGGGRVITREINSHYVFSSKELGVGNYSIYVTVSNSVGYVDTNKLRFKIYEKEVAHKYSNWTVVKKATCTVSGTEQRKCSICGNIETRTVNATGHKYVNKVVEPTTTQKGYTIHTCSVCGYNYKDNYTSVKKQLQGITITAKPSKTTYYINDSIDTTGLKVVAAYSDGSKSEVRGWKVSGTTAKVGKVSIQVSYTEGNTTKTASYEILVTESDHRYGNWSVTKKATCTTGGTEQRKCSVCGKVESRTVNAVGHKYVDQVIAPTATEKGYTLHTCSVCGYSYKDNYTEAKPQPVKKAVVSIAYDANGGYISQKTQSGTVGDTVQLTYECPTKSVYVVFKSNGGDSNPDPVILYQKFMRWVYTSTAGEIGYYPGDSLQLKEDCTLRAQYEVAKLTTLPVIERNGYTFDGWYTADNVRVYEGMVLTEKTTVLTAHWTPQQAPTASDDQISQTPATKDDLSQTGNTSGASDWSGAIDDGDLEQPDGKDDEIITVGDEIEKNDAIYTITKMNDDFCVEYSEMFDDDVEDTYIPDTIAINGTVYRVTSIGSNAFYKNQSLKKIVIGGYIERIDAKAFYGCTSLRDIVINSTKIKNGKIGANAFKKVNKNVRVIVPTSKYKAYKKMLKKAGIGTKAKIYKMKNL